MRVFSSRLALPPLLRSRRLWVVLAVAACFALAVRVAFEVAVRNVSLPPSTIDRLTPSVRFHDSTGALIHVSRGYDYRWNFPVKYSDLPPDLIRYFIAVEDSGFFDHHGVDWLAGGRAFWQMLSSGRIVSGASTITMQVMTMFTGRERTLRYKIRQILLACNWEKNHTKEEILEYYFNNLPFGGKLYGVEAAAQYYFGRHVGDLNRAEMALLAGLPQSPSRYRPDRHPARGIQRRDVVLHLLVKNGVLSNEEADEIRHETLRYRRFETRLWPQVEDTHYLQLALAANPGRREYRLALDTQLQAQVAFALKNGIASLQNVKDGAAVIVENATGHVRACVGTLDFQDEVDGKVNQVVAWRSPGSTLKPFIYGEAISAGMIVQETILKDEKLLLKDYRPANFDGAYRGCIPAWEALADSLNTPAVRLLQQVGVERTLELLRGLGVVRGGVYSATERVGLSLAIGGAETNLLALAGAYSRIAGGVPRLSFLEDADAQGNVSDGALWSPGVRQMLLWMLRRKSLPGAGGLDVAWKTGTSNGNRDAWCVAVTPKWTVAVWYGNKSGASSPSLVGATAAAPVAGAIMQSLHLDGLPLWKEDQSLVAETRLCAKTGLAATSGCVDTKVGRTVAGIPLRPCGECRRNGGVAEKTCRIVAPQPGSYHPRVPGGNLWIRLETTPPEAHLYVDGGYRGLHKSGGRIELAAGVHEISIWGGDGYGSDRIRVVVE